MANFSFDNPTDELLNMLDTEMTDIKQRLDEISQQVETYENMVRREENRSASIASQLRTLQDNFDSVPREDIRARYDEALDARFRLASIQGQVELFRTTKKLLEDERKILSEVISKIRGGIEVSTAATDAPAAVVNNNSNIIRIIRAQEDERRRLANQIHDGPAQSLTNFVLQAEICQRLFDRNPEAAKEELINLKESASGTFQRVRDFISDLRPMMLDDLGVIPTIRKYIESFSSKSDIKVTLDIGGQEDRRLEEYQEVMIFRGIQDLIGHARDYAEATALRVRLDIARDRAIVMVEDNGRFFDAETQLENAHADDPRAQGIITLREKFELVGGTVSINSMEGTLTEVHFEIPVGDRER